MNYQDFKKKQLLLELQNNITSIASFNKLAIDDIKLFNSNLDKDYSIDGNKSPLDNIIKELDDLQNKINESILINIQKELVKMK